MPESLLQPEFLAAAYGALAGALVGALVSGLISYFLQRQAFCEMKKQRDEDRQRLQQSLGYTLLFKVTKIHGNFCNLNQSLEKSFARARRNDSEKEPWKFVRAFASLPSQISFSEEEQSMLFAITDDHLVRAVLWIDHSHNNVLDIAKTYSTRRGYLIKQLSPHATPGQPENFIKHAKLTPQQKSALEVHTTAANGIAKQLREYVRTGLTDSENALDNLRKVLKKELGISYDPEFLQ